MRREVQAEKGKDRGKLNARLSLFSLMSASQNTWEGDIITPISQMRKVRRRGAHVA